MKIKRFVDKDMRQVLRRVREDQGPDAVILSNRRVEDGIEVIAAVDYDEALVQHALGSSQATPQTADANADAVAAAASADATPEEPTEQASSQTDGIEVLSAELESRPIPTETSAADRPGEVGETAPAGPESLEALQCEISNMRGVLETQLSELLWKEQARTSPSRTQILRNLTKIGIGPDIANMIANRLPPIDNPKDYWRAPLLELAQCIPVCDDDLIEKGGVAALVGPTGVGKTTTIAKIAFRYAIENNTNDIALISADAHRIGAQEHLATFAKLLGVSVYPAENLDALEELLDQLADKSLVLIDTEGTSQRDVDLTARLAAYGRNENRVRFYLTLASPCQEAGLDETIRIFNRVPLAGAIVTKIDEAAQLGCALGALIRHDLPIAYVADGQRIPDDLHAASRKRLWLVNQAVDAMRSSDIRISEDMMVDRFAGVGAAHA